MRNWDSIDQEAQSAGAADLRLRQYQPKRNYKSILYNNVVRTGQIPAMIVKTKLPVKHTVKPKHKLPVFNLIKD